MLVTTGTKARATMACNPFDILDRLASDVRVMTSELAPAVAEMTRQTSALEDPETKRQAVILLRASFDDVLAALDAAGEPLREGLAALPESENN